MTNWSMIGAIKYSFKKKPFLISLILLNELFIGSVTIFQVLLLSKFINSICEMYTTGKGSPQILLWILLLGAIYVMTAVSETIIKAGYIKFEADLKNEFDSMFIKKNASLQYQYIENNEILDLLKRTNEKPIDNLRDSVRMIFKTLGDIISVFGVIVMLFVAGWQIGLLMLGISAIIYNVSIRLGEGIHTWWMKNVKQQRMYEYCGNLLIEREFVAEKKLFGYEDYISEEWGKKHTEYNQGRVKNQSNALIKLSLSHAISALFKLTIYILLITSLAHGNITLGFFMGLARTIGGVQGFVSSQLSKSIVDISRLNKYWKDVNYFFDLDEIEFTNDSLMKSGTVEFESVEFRDVWFKYPTMEEYILKGVNFTIKKGKNYSLVGENGSGKSTIIKLILGLYTPDKGTILINGRNIVEMDYRELRNYYSVVFQDYAKYQLTIKENIMFGNMECIDENSIESVAKKVGIHDKIVSLKKGYNSNLGKIMDDGVELSEGEWQKIAICRAVTNIAPIQILDEPVASLDPIAESNLYRNYATLMKDKTTLLISHRLGSTTFADVIFVLSKGVIVESGNQEALVKEDGIYAQMYNAQRKWYRQ